MKRINTYDGKGHTLRELESVSRNEFGDILFTLDGGEVWQFTPALSDAERKKIWPGMDIPDAENVEAVCRDPRWQGRSTLDIAGSVPIICGDIRIIPPPATRPAPGKATRQTAKAPPGKRGRRPLSATAKDAKDEKRVAAAVTAAKAEGIKDYIQVAADRLDMIPDFVDMVWERVATRRRREAKQGRKTGVTETKSK